VKKKPQKGKQAFYKLIPRIEDPPRGKGREKKTNIAGRANHPRESQMRLAPDEKKKGKNQEGGRKDQTHLVHFLTSIGQKGGQEKK